MYSYDYCRPATLQELSKVLIELGPDAAIVAGGTDIMVQIREKDKRWAKLSTLVDVTYIDEMHKIEDCGEELFIGATSTHTEIEVSELVQKYVPFLSVACSTVGSPQIRNRGTLGGSICNASPAADPLTPLVAMNARVVICGIDGEREVNIVEFYKEKGQVDLDRAKGEFVKGYMVPKVSEGAVTVFQKLGRRKALAISRLNASILLAFAEDGSIKEAKIAPGCIFRTPSRVPEAEELLIGKMPSEELFKEAGEMVSKVMIDKTGWRWSTEYKKPAVEGVIAQALEKAAGMEA